MLCVPSSSIFKQSNCRVGVCVCAFKLTILRVEEEKKKTSCLMKEAWGTSQSSMTDTVESLMEHTPWDDCNRQGQQKKVLLTSTRHLTCTLRYFNKNYNNIFWTPCADRVDVPASRPPAAVCVCTVPESLVKWFQPLCPETCWDQSSTPADGRDKETRSVTELKADDQKHRCEIKVTA